MTQSHATQPTVSQPTRPLNPSERRQSPLIVVGLTVFTENENDELINLYEAGKDWAEISEKFGISGDDLESYLPKLLKKRHLDPKNSGMIRKRAIDLLKKAKKANEKFQLRAAEKGRRLDEYLETHKHESKGNHQPDNQGSRRG